VPDLTDLVALFIREHFERISVDRLHGTENANLVIATDALHIIGSRVVFGVISGFRGFVRSRGQYFDPRQPDFFDKLKAEFETCCKLDWGKV